MAQHDELFSFKPDEESSVPLWMQLSNRIKYLIESGCYKPGDQLPKIRELAVEIAINFNTVNRAYLNLQSEGLLKSVRGKGVFVTELAAPLTSDSSKAHIEALLDMCLHACQDLGVTYEETAALMLQRARRLRSEGDEGKSDSKSNVIIVIPGEKPPKEAHGS